MLDWELVARAHLHPVRIAVLESFESAHEPLSAAMIARSLGEPLGNIAHHVRALRALGLIDPAGMRQVRGAVEHFYVLRP